MKTATLTAAFYLGYLIPSQAVIISPNVQPVESGYRLIIRIAGEDLVLEADSLLGGAIGGQERKVERLSIWGLSQGAAFSYVGAENGRPFATAVSSLLIRDRACCLVPHQSTSQARLLYGFAIETKSVDDPPISQIPISIHVKSRAVSDVNGTGSASVYMRRGHWAANDGGIMNGITFYGDELWRHLVYAPQLYDGMVENEEIKTELVDINTQYMFAIWAAATAERTYDEQVFAGGFADPIVEFDQAAFDEMMGDDTFLLEDYFQIGYSPGSEALFVPEPPGWCTIVIAIGCICWRFVNRHRSDFLHVDGVQSWTWK